MVILDLQKASDGADPDVLLCKLKAVQDLMKTLYSGVGHT